MLFFKATDGERGRAFQTSRLITIANSPLAQRLVRPLVITNFLNMWVNIMNRILIFLSILLVANATHAKGVGKDAGIEVSTYPNGLVFDVRRSDTDLQLTISGPGNYVSSRRHPYAESVFLGITNATGKRLADGLYKYEARPMPAVSISREESSIMQGRNVLHGKTDAKISPFSGTFRIANGRVVDPAYDEYNAPALAPTESIK